MMSALLEKEQKEIQKEISKISSDRQALKDLVYHIISGLVEDIKNFKKSGKNSYTANFEILNFKKRLLRIFLKTDTIVFLK